MLNPPKEENPYHMTWRCFHRLAVLLWRDWGFHAHVAGATLGWWV